MELSKLYLGQFIKNIVKLRQVYSFLILAVSSPFLILVATAKTPAQAAYEQAFGRIDNGYKSLQATFCLNAYAPKRGSRVNLWTCNKNDPDQKWERILLLPDGVNDNKFLVRRVGTNLCLNAYQPRNESVVNLWNCDKNDPDQKWENIGFGEVNAELMKRAGTNLCLNAHKPRNESVVNLWTCDQNDIDQIWKNIPLNY
jgi:Ricin-type beta-trefoil lectin domain